MKAFREAPAAVKLALACAFVFPTAIVLLRMATAEYHLAPYDARRWVILAAVEFLTIVPALILLGRLRAGRWLWLVWLVASANFTTRKAALLSVSPYSILLVSLYIGWCVKLIITAMLFLRRPEPSDPPAKTPNKAPEPTPTAVTPRAMERKEEVKKWIAGPNEARGAPAAVVAHL